MPSIQRRSLSLLLVLSMMVSSLAVLIPTFSTPADAAARPKVKYTVCHRTNAIKNPYRLITVAWSSVDDNNNGHDNPVHDGPVFDVNNPLATHGSTPRDTGLGSEAGGGNDRWGDIFFAEKNAGQWNANNWFVDDTNKTSGANTAGQAIFNGATFTIGNVTKKACRSMSAKDYIESEREENPSKPMTEIMDELDDMGAAEDLPLKNALGGGFRSWLNTCTVNCDNTSVIASAIEEKSAKVTTEPPTNLVGNGTNSSATLNGTITPFGNSMTWYFELLADTSDFDNNGSSIVEVVPNPNTPSTAQGPVNVTLNTTGLDSTKTYYYRTVGLVSSGSNDDLVESYLYGVIKQFRFDAPGSPTITAVTCGNGSLSVAFTAPTVNPSNLASYDYSVNGGLTYTNVAAVTSPISITGLTNGTRYDVVIRAKTASLTGLDSVAVAGIPCGVPVAVTDPASPVTRPSTTIRGNLTGNGNPLTVTFIWGTDPSLASGTTTSNASPSSLPGTANSYPVTFNVTNLTPGTTYYYKVVGTYGGGSTVEGLIEDFIVPEDTSQNSNTSNDPLGRVIGTAWFDIDRDNRRDTNEPLLPGVDVQLTPISVTGQSAGSVRKKNYVMKTDSSGAFDFSQLPPGTYKITSLLPGDFGIQESWDSSGNTDWQVTVTVVALQTSRGDFAAIAPAEATGTVDGGGGGTLDATWTGFDQKNDTDDDVTFTVKLSGNGGFTLQGLPTGKYSVKATSKTGRTLVSSNSLRITSKGATLSINGLTMKVKIVAFLPATGASNMLNVFGFAAMLIPAGIAATTATRRRRRRRLS